MWLLCHGTLLGCCGETSDNTLIEARGWERANGVDCCVAKGMVERFHCMPRWYGAAGYQMNVEAGLKPAEGECEGWCLLWWLLVAVGGQHSCHAFAFFPSVAGLAAPTCPSALQTTTLSSTGGPGSEVTTSHRTLQKFEPPKTWQEELNPGWMKKGKKKKSKQIKGIGLILICRPSLDKSNWMNLTCFFSLLSFFFFTCPHFFL